MLLVTEQFFSINTHLIASHNFVMMRSNLSGSLNFGHFSSKTKAKTKI